MNFFLLVKDLCWHSLIFFVVTALGYLFVSGSLYALVFLRGAAQDSPIATRKLKADLSIRNIWLSVRHDVVLSLWSAAIFAVCASLMTTAYTLGYTRLYTEPAQYGWGYLGFSLCLVLFLQDTYFYFTHRLAHHPKCYRWMHQGHHRSNNPTPLTAFSFDPAEALVQALYLIGAVCFIPMHLLVLYAVVLVMSLGALLHHFSIRMFADSAFGRWLGSWMIGPMHHWYHHRKYTVHYGLYFTFWDKLLGTHCEGYEEKLASQTAPQIASQCAEPSGKPSLSIARSPQRKTLPFPVPFKKAS